MEWLLSPEIWIALLTLTAVEIVLGIDNIIFLSIIVSKLPADQQPRARLIGLSLAMLMRILLLLGISWLAGLTAALFTVLERGISVRDLILLGGGLFLLYKSTVEIHANLEGSEEVPGHASSANFWSVIVQIGLIDLVFSLDSVITAIGLVQQVPVMVVAIVIAVLVMMIAAAPISRFVHQHPTIKILALSFLMLIGTALIGEGLGMHIPKGYLYFAMAFSVMVEMLNIRVRKIHQPVQLKRPDHPDSGNR